MKNFIFTGLCVLTLGFSGCASVSDGTLLDSDTKRGAALGAVTGAAIGGIVGHQDDHGWEGALIGAAAGGTGGGLLGNQLEKRSYSAANYIPVTEIVEMSQGGVPDSTIMSEINRSRSQFDMTLDTINYLQNNGVSGEVIDYMIEVSP